MKIKYVKQRRFGYCFAVEEDGTIRVQWGEDSRTTGWALFWKIDNQYSLEPDFLLDLPDNILLTFESFESSLKS